MAEPLTFGLFPLGLAGSPDGVASGAPDDFEQISAAVAELQGDGPPIMPRMYVSWTGPRSTKAVLRQVGDYAELGLPWDLVLCYRDRSGSVAKWASFVSRVVAEHGRQLAAIQVTGEANLPGIPAAADGAYPAVREALVQGVLGAATTKRESAALDYAGIDMYPDVFGPRFGLDRLPGAVDWLLRTFRECDLSGAGIPAAVPIRICENGWPTGPDRPEQTQADVFEAILRTVHGLRAELNVTHWELFTLRDADSARDGLFNHFGILRDDYSRKPAFARLRTLIAELGRPAPL